jgi:hypothetical protein
LAAEQVLQDAKRFAVFSGNWAVWEVTNFLDIPSSITEKTSGIREVPEWVTTMALILAEKT